MTAAARRAYALATRRICAPSAPHPEETAIAAPPPEKPSIATRAAFFVGGALVGGVIGYGIVSSGPVPPPSIFEPRAAFWVFGLAAVIGTISAIATWRVFRRRFEPRRDDER